MKSMLRVGIDFTSLDRGNVGHGLYRYVTDLITGLTSPDLETELVVFGSRRNPVPEVARLIQNGRRLSYKHFASKPGRLGRLTSQARWSLLLWHQNIDVLHFPKPSLPVLTACPIVTTVADMMYELFPEYAEFSRSREYRFSRWGVESQARRVIAISQSSADDLMRLWRVRSSKVDVIHLGSSLRATAPSDLENSADGLGGGNFILSPYNLEPRKNLAGLLTAFARLVGFHPECRLVLFGRAAVTPQREQEMDALIRELGLTEYVRQTGFVDDRVLADLMARARMFAFPSLYEGFGLPILEAMSNGVPVVAVRASAMTEVVGEAGLLVEDGGAEALSGAMLRILDDPRLSAKLRSLGLERAKKFTIERMARATLETYRKAIAP